MSILLSCNIRMHCNIKKYAEKEAQMAIVNYKLKQHDRFIGMNDDFVMFDQELRLIISLPTDESRINRYNDILEDRYCNLYLKIASIINDEEVSQK